MKTIAVDIDDVLADENTSIIDFVNHKFGLDLGWQDYEIDAPYWGYWETVWAQHGIIDTTIYESYMSSGIKEQHAVLDNALEVINALKQKYRLVIITARDDYLMSQTERWLDKYFPQTFDHVAFARVWNNGEKATKAEVAQHLGASYLIDDSADHCNLAADAGIQALLFGSYGWNKSQPINQSVIRVADWLAVKEYFDGKNGA